MKQSLGKKDVMISIGPRLHAAAIEKCQVLEMNFSEAVCSQLRRWVGWEDEEEDAPLESDEVPVIGTIAAGHPGDVDAVIESPAAAGQKRRPQRSKVPVVPDRLSIKVSSKTLGGSKGKSPPKN